MLSAELVRPASTELSIKEIAAQYNRLAAMVGGAAVTRFKDKATAVRRLEAIQAEARARFVVAPERKRRQKVFNYPPLSEIKTLNPGSLRAEARDLLLTGATLGRIEQLVAEWDKRAGKKPHRVEQRAYGLVRLLHSYVGYALREEGVGEARIIYLMDKEAWTAWKAKKAA